MGTEITVSAIIIEEGKGYRAECPDLGLSAKGASVDEALKNLKDAAASHVREKGSSIQLNSVKCLKFKVPVE